MPNARGASRHCWGASFIRTTSMSSIVVIFVPWGDKRSDSRATPQKPIDVTESIENPDAIRSEPIDDAEQMPLWRWFTF